MRLFRSGLGEVLVDCSPHGTLYLESVAIELKELLFNDGHVDGDENDNEDEDDNGDDDDNDDDGENDANDDVDFV